MLRIRVRSAGTGSPAWWRPRKWRPKPAGLGTRGLFSHGWQMCEEQIGSRRDATAQKFGIDNSFASFSTSAPLYETACLFGGFHPLPSAVGYILSALLSLLWDKLNRFLSCAVGEPLPPRAREG